jgi:lipid A 3-O-deacylase
VKLLLFCLFFIASYGHGVSQEITNPKKLNRIDRNGFELRHDNDFLLYTDHYYTAGTFIGLRSRAEKKNDSANALQYSFFILQEIYTPSELISRDINKFDRPYVGLFGITNGITLTKDKRLLDFKLLLGFTGPLSGGSKVQSVFHEYATQDSTIPAWESEIKNGMLINLYFNYVREWKIQSNPFSVNVALSPSSAFGTKDIYLQNDIVGYFGRRSSMENSSAYRQIGSYEKELFFAVRLGYRYVFHNTLLEGNLLGDSSVLLKDPYQNLFLYNFEIYYRSGRNSYKVSYNFATPETSGTKPHLYVLMSILRSF